MTKATIDVAKKELTMFAKIAKKELSKVASKLEGHFNLIKLFYEADVITRTAIMIALFMCIYAFMRISFKVSKYISKILVFSKPYVVFNFLSLNVKTTLVKSSSFRLIAFAFLI